VLVIDLSKMELLIVVTAEVIIAITLIVQIVMDLLEKEEKGMMICIATVDLDTDPHIIGKWPVSVFIHPINQSPSVSNNYTTMTTLYQLSTKRIIQYKTE